MKGSINKRVRELRTALGLSQSEFANETEISFSLLSKIETTTESPSQKVIQKILRRWNVDVDWFLEGNGELKIEKVGINEKINVSSNPWREEAYSLIKEERDYFKEKYTKVIDALISGNLGKLLALKNAGKLRKVA